MSQRNPRTIEQLEALLKEIEGVGENVRLAIQKMRDAKLDVVQSSGETVLRAYLPGLARFSTALIQDVSESITARNLGIPTRYESRQREYERQKNARLEAAREKRKKGGSNPTPEKGGEK